MPTEEISLQDLPTDMPCGGACVQPHRTVRKKSASKIKD
jgi:hypothetical protein